MVTPQPHVPADPGTGGADAAAALEGLLAELEHRLASDSWDDDGPGTARAATVASGGDPDPRDGAVPPSVAALLARAASLHQALTDELAATQAALSELRRRRDAASAYNRS